jgi:hypothetical protein
MAKFVYSETGEPGLTLEAEPGEEIPVEMVAAYAAMRTAWALEALADSVRELDNGLFRISEAMVQ